MMREFRRAYHQFSQHIPKQEMIDEWLSIMQHHGTPTRLLDVTYSIYVAAYFAVEEAEGDSAIWAIDAVWAKKRSIDLLEDAGKDSTALTKMTMDDDGEITKLLMTKPYVTAAVPMNPFRLNERLRVQQGAFLIQGDISKPFDENFGALLRNRNTDKIIKIKIPARLLPEARACLWSMDISRATLFPGLDGFARSLGINHPLFNPTKYPGHAGE